MLAVAFSVALAGCGGNKAPKIAYRPAPPPKPTVTLAFAPTSARPHQNVTLNWSSTNAVDCTASSKTIQQFNGKVSASGALALTDLAAGGYDASLMCQNATGQASASASLSVTPPKVGGIYRQPTRADTPQPVGCLIAPDGHGKCFVRNLDDPNQKVVVYSMAPIQLSTDSDGTVDPHFSVVYTQYTTLDSTTYAPPPASASSTAQPVYTRPLLADSPLGKGIASGTLMPGQSLDVTFTPADGGAPYHLQVDGGPLPYDGPDADRAASLSTLAGRYQLHYVDSGTTQPDGYINIDDNGTISGVEYTPQCSFSGGLSVPDAGMNLYQGTMTRDCQPQSGGADDPVTLDVLSALFDDGSAPPRLLIVATGGDRKAGGIGGGSQ